jgi:formylglycine-generating enzyme required for sulfatase activity
LLHSVTSVAAQELPLPKLKAAPPISATGEDETAAWPSSLGYVQHGLRPAQKPRSATTHVDSVDGFWIDRTEVTNRSFAKFRRRTGYVTRRARRRSKVQCHLPKKFPEPGSSPHHAVGREAAAAASHNGFSTLPGPTGASRRARLARLPGPGEPPMVPLAYEDALRCAWVGRSFHRHNGCTGSRRSVTAKTIDCAFDADGKPLAKRLAGYFPVHHYQGRWPTSAHAPVGCSTKTATAHDMSGNVLGVDKRWYRAGHAQNVRSSTRTKLDDLRLASGQLSRRKAIKAVLPYARLNYCARYRPAARQPQEVDLAQLMAAFDGAQHVRAARARIGSYGSRPAGAALLTLSTNSQSCYKLQGSYLLS